jgi:Tol biopolymer transport system component/tRNA A-37 threonylcarbamoyl transferase component Bud32
MPEALPALATALADRYRLERQLGEGGMATVYLADDFKHGRHVAIKVLRPELAAVIGAERFVREIRTIAALQHPHILGLIDSGEVNGTAYYVMPFVEGESLRDRLTREKQLPVEDAVRVAKEIASALDYAHRHGVIHRDIKPENILLHDGSALVADFGIALAASKASGTRMTETGMSLGTPHYMSPEQAMGEREITARSDVYALGCVLYEMLIGEPPFTGPTAQAIVARMMTEAPRPLSLHRHTVPPHVEHAVQVALEKLPADRFASAAEFAAALGGTGYAPAATATTAIPARAKGRAWRARAPLGLTLVGGLVLGAAAMAVFRRPPPAPVLRYGLALPAAQEPLNPGGRAIPSPDGSRIAYVGPDGNDIQLWIKYRDRSDAVPLAGTTGVSNFTWSPDGQWIAYVFGGQVRKIPAAGGSAITVADGASGNTGITWLDDDTIIYIRAGGIILRRVSAAGGPVEDVVADSAALRLPTPLPGGRGFLYIRCMGGGCRAVQELWAYDARSRESHLVAPGVTLGQYVPTGHLILLRRDGAGFAVPFDLDRLETRGAPVPVLDSVATLDGIVPLFGLSSSGTLVTRVGSVLSRLRQYQMVWTDRAGREEPVDPNWTVRFVEFGANAGWALSPDGRRLALGLQTDAGDDIWVKQLPHGTLSRVSYDSAAEYRPRWMPDGRSLMFASNRLGAGAGGLYLRPADGTGSDSLILRARAGIFEGAWSPDRRWLVFRTGGTVNQTGGRDIVGIRPGIDTVPLPIVATPYDEEAIAISPDGRWLAYESNETGKTEIYLRPFPDTQRAKWQVSNGGAAAPLWARNGRELFFVTRERDLMAVSVTAGAEPQLGPARRLFRLDEKLLMSNQEFYTPFDVAPDGRFLMARDVTPPHVLETRLVVVENWFTELRARLGKP